VAVPVAAAITTPAAIKPAVAPPATISIAADPLPTAIPEASMAGAGWERSQSTLPSVGSAMDEMFSSSQLSKPPVVSPRHDHSRRKKKEAEVEDPSLANSPTFAQVRHVFCIVWIICIVTHRIVIPIKKVDYCLHYHEEYYILSYILVFSMVVMVSFHKGCVYFKKM
jgi:hypothetical protein